jgi:serine/threonine protein kinase
MGIILYEMLTGAPPFLSEGFGDVLLMHLTQPPKPPREIEPKIPPSLEKLVLHALEKEPERRLADMGELLHGLIGPAARTTVREGIDPNDPQYAETDVIPRLRAGSSGARRTTFSSTASQVMGDTERLSARRKRLAFGLVAAGALAVIGVAALSGGRPEAPAASAAAQPPTPAPEPAVPSVPTPAANTEPAIPPPGNPEPTTANPEPATAAASEPPAVPPRAAAEIDPTPAAAPPASSTPRRQNAGKQIRGGRPRKPSGTAPAVGGLPPPAPRPAAAASEFAPLPDKPAAPGPATMPAPPPATTPPPAPTRTAVPAAHAPSAPSKPKLSTDKW